MRGKIIAAVIPLLLILMLGPVLLSFIVKERIEKSLKLEIQSVFKPKLFVTSFMLDDAHLKWKDKVKLNSGSLEVSYFPTQVLFSPQLRVRIFGNDLSVELYGEWSAMYQIQNEKIHHFDFDVTLSTEGIEDIHQLNIESPAIRFHFGERQQKVQATP